MNGRLFAHIPTGYAQDALNRVGRNRGVEKVNIGVPATKDHRPYLSTEDSVESDKVRSDLHLRTIKDPEGRTCLYFSLQAVNGAEFRSPVLLDDDAPDELAHTVSGDCDAMYESFEAVVRASDGAFILHAIQADGERQVFDIEKNRVPKVFTRMVVLAATKKIPL